MVHPPSGGQCGGGCNWCGVALEGRSILGYLRTLGQIYLSTCNLYSSFTNMLILTAFMYRTSHQCITVANELEANEIKIEYTTVVQPARESYVRSPLRTLATQSPCKGNVFRLDSHPLGMDRSQVDIFKQRRGAPPKLPAEPSLPRIGNADPTM